MGKHASNFTDVEVPVGATPMIITLNTTNNKQYSAAGRLFIASGTLLSKMVDTTPLVDSEKEKKIGHKFFGTSHICLDRGQCMI